MKLKITYIDTPNAYNGNYGTNKIKAVILNSDFVNVQFEYNSHCIDPYSVTKVERIMEADEFNTTDYTQDQ